MAEVVIIGAGQLGSRHLQGLKTARSSLNIWVLDNNPASLNVAEERYNSVNAVGEKAVHFVNDIQLLPNELDLVIVATGSKPRSSIVRSLTNNKHIQNFVLEKVLFPSLCEYEEIADLLEANEIKCWVNCPRRMYGYYQRLHDEIDNSQPLHMSLIGKDWGLCCNAMHFIDVFKYLCKDEIKSVSNSDIVPEIIESKRPGYIEMNGKLTVTSMNGNILILESTKEYNGDMILTIRNGEKEWIICEPKGWLKCNDNEYTIHVPFQSQLTGELTDMILGKGTCPLASYNESAKMHKVFLASIIESYNKITGEQHTSCPIT